MIITPRDIEILAATIYGEARGETQQGKEMVGWSIRNRAEIDLGNDGKPDWWGEGIAGVCLAPWQFSCWNANDPNRAKMLALGLPQSLADPVYRDCLLAALTVAQAPRIPADLVGITHYYAAGIPAPAWAAKAEFYGCVGGHLFYRKVP